MTKNIITIELTCNGKTLLMGPGEDIDINAVTGLESSELEISTSDNALVDGASVDGKKIKPRAIHIEASFKSNKDNAANRAAVIKFFNPKYTGKALITCMGVSRNIEYELEGWTFKKTKNVDQKLGIIVDLLCPDPYMLNVDNFGKNMANITPLFAFPWMMLSRRASGKLDYNPKARGLLLGGATMGYRTLHKEVVLANDGDVSTGVQIQFIATRGEVTNPKITNTLTGQYMRVNIVMQQGDVLLIDTNERHQVITLNGVNCYQKIDRKSEPFQLDVGDNYLEYDADVNYTNLDVNLFYTPKYLGV
ncbi:MAG: phage tail family protein [Bacteroidales bacterium]|nr:phage tail family protein [Candidatus Liminaster caballi]